MLYGNEKWNLLTETILECCVEVHRHLGPGLLESIYEECLVLELSDRGMSFERQIPLPVVYKGRLATTPFRLDLLVEKAVVVGLKSVERTAPIHLCQVITYLKLTGAPVGLLVNFHVPLLKDGVKRVVRPDLLPQRSS